jgi:hypothetical protein
LRARAQPARTRHYLTSYTSGSGRSSNARVAARSFRHAAQLVKSRGLGETVDGLLMAKSGAPTRASVVFASAASVAQKFHALCWLSYVALASGKVDHVDLFDDDVGMLHEAAHYLQGDVWFQGGRRAYRRKVLQLIRRVERRVPGLA